MSNLVDDDVAMTRATDAEAAATDPRAAFEAFVADSGPALGRLALFLAGDTHRAEELLQQTYVRTWGAWSRIRDDDPHRYARRVMANQRVDTWRRGRREAVTEPDRLPEQAVPDAGDRLADRDQLVRALRALPERRRRVVVLRYVTGLSEAETATTLRITTGTVKSTAARGLAQLRAALEKEQS